MKAGSRELYKPQGCLPLWPEEEAEVYPSHSSAGDATAFDLQVTRRQQTVNIMSVLGFKNFADSKSFLEIYS